MNRILYIKDLAQAREELSKIGVSSRGIEVMAPKCLGMTVKLTDVMVGAANILKQEMLVLGGDAAVARGVVEGTSQTSDLLLIGSVDIFEKLIARLKDRDLYGLSAIAADLDRFLKLEKGSSLTRLNCRGRKLSLGKTLLMGILNITPDSFSDGEDFLAPDKAIGQAVKMAGSGADIIDIGGESSRPGALRISATEELARILPVITELKKCLNTPLSVDTYKAEVAGKALEAGASLVNDISALRFDPEMIAVLRDFKEVPIVLMHMLGTPETMQKDPRYTAVIDEIMNFFRERINFCLDNGLDENRIIIDPGIGFGKRQKDNLEIFDRLGEFRSLGFPVMIGASRKSFIGRIYDSRPKDRIEGSLATTAIAHHNGIHILRVHDVDRHKKMLRVLEAIEGKV